MDKAPDYESGDSVGSTPTAPTTQCPRCKRREPDITFGSNNRRSNGKQTYCSGCQKEYTRQHYTDNTAYYKDKTRRRKLEIRRFVYEYLLTHPCVGEGCLENDPIVLTFDHKDDKKFNIADAVNHGYSEEKIKEEIAKCQVMCFNCHARKTAKQFDWYKDIKSGVPHGRL